MTTWFRYGAPARVEVLGLDGGHRTIAVARQLPDDLGRPPAEIDYAVAHLPSGLLRDYEIVDTPGLGTMNATTTQATRRVLLGATANGGVDPPEGILFLCDNVPRADETGFLAELGASRINTVALLSHADMFGEGVFGSDDPLQAAASHADRLSAQLPGVAAAVLPVSGLLAETALTGHLTEGDARALADLAGRDASELEDLLAGGDDELGRLTALVGEYGVLHGRTVAGRGAAALAQWLVDKSGLGAVREHIVRRFVCRGDVLKARRVLLALRQAAAAATAQPRTDPGHLGRRASGPDAASVARALGAGADAGVGPHASARRAVGRLDVGDLGDRTAGTRPRRRPDDSRRRSQRRLADVPAATVLGDCGGRAGSVDGARAQLSTIGAAAAVRSARARRNLLRDNAITSGSDVG